MLCVHFINEQIGWTVGHGGTILKTTNGGINWFSQNSGIVNSIFSVYFTDDQIGWAVGGGWNSCIILKTTNGGDNWFEQNSGTNNALLSVYFIDSITGWATGELGTVLKTTDGGENWILQQNNSPYGLMSVFFIDNQNGWAVGPGGIIANTSDGGENWFIQNAGITNNLYSIHFTDDQTGWVVGEYGTILHTTNGGVTFIEEENNYTQPNDFLLQQNYPNPFNPSTKISWQSPVGSHQTLKIYNLLGSEVETLVDEYKSAGTYEVEFNAAKYTSGVYFYRLQAGSFVETKKMILMK